MLKVLKVLTRLTHPPIAASRPQMRAHSRVASYLFELFWAADGRKQQ